MFDYFSKVWARRSDKSVTSADILNVLRVFAKQINFAWGPVMDKSFNDQELSDIMKEIEALEEDFKADEGEKVEPVAAMEEFSQTHEKKSEPDFHAAEELHHEPEDHHEVRPEAEVYHLSSNEVKAQSSSPASMSFKVQGDLCLEMQFEVNGKCVSLNVSETGLNIMMEGGVTFNVPLEKKKAA
ncbi:MAG: hypothetical protein AB7I27_18215 [Bacteriovoracaceae bacterium]